MKSFSDLAEGHLDTSSYVSKLLPKYKISPGRSITLLSLELAGLPYWLRMPYTEITLDTNHNHETQQ